MLGQSIRLEDDAPRPGRGSAVDPAARRSVGRLGRSRAQHGAPAAVPGRVRQAPGDAGRARCSVRRAPPVRRLRACTRRRPTVEAVLDAEARQPGGPASPHGGRSAGDRTTAPSPGRRAASPRSVSPTSGPSRSHGRPVVKPAPGPRVHGIGVRQRDRSHHAKSGPDMRCRRVDALLGRDVDVAASRAPRRSTGMACHGPSAAGPRPPGRSRP